MASSSSPADALVLGRILRHGDELPERIAIVHPHRRGWGRLSYRALATRVRHVAAGLSQRGVGRADRVVLLVPMSAELYVVLRGRVARPPRCSSSRGGPREIARAIPATRPAALSASPSARASLFDVTAIPSAWCSRPRLAARLLGGDPGGARGRGRRPELSRSRFRPGLCLLGVSTGVPNVAVRINASSAPARGDRCGSTRGRTDGAPTSTSAFSIVLLSRGVRHTAVSRGWAWRRRRDGAALAAASGSSLTGLRLAGVHRPLFAAACRGLPSVAG